MTKRLAWLSLCLLPMAYGLWRYKVIYLADGDAIWHQYRFVALYPADLLAGMVAGCWLLDRLRSRRSLKRDKASMVAGALALMALASAASVPFAGDRSIAAGITIQLAVLVLFFLAASDLIATFGATPLMATIGLAVSVQAVLAVWQTVEQTTFPAGALLSWTAELTAADRGASVVELPGLGRWLRAYGSFPHPNSLGGFLAVCLAIVLVRGRELGGVVRWLVLPLGFLGLVLSFSRAALLAAFLPTLILLVADRQKGRAGSRRRPSIFRLIAVALLAISFSGLVAVRLSSFGGSLEQTSIAARLFYDSIAWRVAASGWPVGAGNLVLAQQKLGLPWNLSEPAHNVFLITAAELGPMGVVSWLVLGAAILSSARKRWGEPDGWVAAAVAIAVFLPLLLFDHYLWTQPPGRVMLVWGLALLCSTRRRCPAGAVDVGLHDVGGSDRHAIG